MSGAAAINYSFSYLPGSLTVNPALLAVTAHDAGRFYGAANPTLTVSYTGFQNSDTAANLTALPSVTTTATPLSPVGTYPLTASGAAATNYSISYVSGTLTVNKATLTVSANSANTTYGAAKPICTVSYYGFVNGDTSGSLPTQPSVATSATAASPAGNYPITASGGVSTNYSFAYIDGTLTVNKAHLTVQPNDAKRWYGVANPSFIVSYSGFLNGDTVSVLTGTASLTTSAKGPVKHA